ncbi:MAG TPA: hypothetical protein VLA29_01585, partial [Acidimicrobiia bacterium]|nr:hypothetical protein [Acidimicrobiia bacterium]
MLAYITRRLVYGLVTLLALSVIVFGLLQASGGGPLDRLKLNPRMQPFIAQLTEMWGLDQPVWKQYTTWLRNYLTVQEFEFQNAIPLVVIAVAAIVTFLILRFVTSRWRGAHLLAVWSVALMIALSNTTIRFNWGISFQGAGDVWDLVFSRVGATFRLGMTALAIALIIGIPLGIYQAIRQYS